MTSDRIEIRSIRVVAPVGVLDEERDRRQPITIDIDVEVDLAQAGMSDALDDTVNYAAVVELAVRCTVASHHDLLESLADEIGRGTLGLDAAIQAVEVSVTKLRPPIALDVATVGVRRRVER